MVFTPYDYEQDYGGTLQQGSVSVTEDNYEPDVASDSEDDWLPSASGKKKPSMSAEDAQFYADIQALSDEELNQLSEDELAQIDAFLTKIGVPDAPADEVPPPPPTNTGNPLTRLGELAGKTAISPFEMLYGLGKQGVDAVTKDPLGSLGEVLGTGYTALDMAAIDPLLGKKVSKGLSNLLGIDTEAHKNAMGAGTLNVGKSLIDGALSLPSDIYNAADYVATGNRKPSTYPLFKTPNLRAEDQQAMAKHPLSALLPQFAAIAATSKLGGKLGKPATTLKGEAVKEAVAGSAVGGVLDPGEGVKDPVERFAMRSGDAFLTGTAMAGAKGLQKVDQVLRKNKRIEQVAKPLSLSRYEAEQLLNKNPNMSPQDLARTISEASDQLKNTSKKDFRMTPSQTAQSTTSSGKAQKGAIAVGTRSEVVDALMGRGKTKDAAEARYAEFDTKRKATTHFKSREALDREIMEEMGVTSVAAPKGGARKTAMGGDATLEEARKAARKASINQLSKVTGLPPKEAIQLSKRVSLPTSHTGTAETLTPRQAFQAKLGLLPEGNLARTTRTAGKVFDKVQEQVPKAQQSIGAARTVLNNLENQLTLGLAGLEQKNPLLRLPIVKEALLDASRGKNALAVENVINDGRLADAMKGDYTRLTIDEAKVVVPVAKALVDFNENVVVPKIRKVYGLNDIDSLTLEDFQNGLLGKVEDVEGEAAAAYKAYEAGALTEQQLIDMGAYVKLDPYHISNVQKGEMVHKVNVSKAKSLMTKDELLALSEKHNVGAEGKDPVMLFGYYDSQVDLVRHLESNQNYKTQYPWLFNKGKVRTELITSEVNNMKVVSDLEYAARLDGSQLQRLRERKPEFVDQLVAQGAGTKAEVNLLLDDMIRKGNVKDPNAPYRRFVGSLQQSEGKLLTQNTNPFQTLYSQSVDLAKRIELEPVINELIIQRQGLEEKLANRNVLKNPKEYQLISDEIHWYKDLEAQYRGKPAELDIQLGNAMEAARNALPENVRRMLSPKYNRNMADYFLAAESTLRLGGNMSASLFNIAEAVRNGLPELTPKAYIPLMQNLGIIPFKDGKFRLPTTALKETIEDMKRHPAADMLFMGRETDSGMNSTFGTSQRMFGSYVVGGLRDTMMLPFEAGTTVGKVLSYNIFKATGQEMGLSGKALDNYVITQMAHTGSMPEMSKLPLTSRSKVASIALLFKSYMIRLADNEWNYMEKALGPEATYDDVYKAVMFTAAPVALVGVQASPTLMLANSLMNSTLGVLQAGEGERPSWEDADRAKGGLATSGILGATTGLNTKAFRADLGSLVDVGGSLPVTEYNNTVKFAQALFEAQRIRLKAQDDLVVDGQKINPDRAANQMMLEAGLNAGRSLSTLGNRAANSADVVMTGGKVRDRQGNIIETIAPEDVPITAAEELVGLRSKEREQAQAAFSVLKGEQNSIEKLERGTKSKIQQWANKADPFSPENLNTYYTLQSSYAGQTGRYVPSETLVEWLGQNKTKIQNLWSSLSPNEQYSMLQNEALKPLLDAYGLSEMSQQGVE